LTKRPYGGKSASPVTSRRLEGLDAFRGRIVPGVVNEPRGLSRSFRTVSASLWRQRVQIVFFLLLIGIETWFLRVENLPQHQRMVRLYWLGVLPMPVRYADFRIVLAGIEGSRAGADVWDSCRPCAAAGGLPGDLPFNYPKTNVWLGRLMPEGWTPNDAEWIGPLIDVTFLLAAATLLCSSHLGQVAFSAAILVSPPVLLGLDRANYDLIIFSLVLLNLRVINKWSNGGAYVTAFALGLLKIYPVVMILGLIKKTKASLLWFLATVAAEIAFIFLALGQIRNVARNSPQTVYPSYGFPLAFRFLQSYLQSKKVPTALVAASGSAFLFLTCFCVVVMFLTWRNRERLIALFFSIRPAERSAFFTGAAVFSLSFAAGLNFNYRLIFLLFTVPHLFAILRDGEAAAARVGRVILVILFAVLWLPLFYRGPQGVFYLSEIVLTWVLFGFFTSGCLAALYPLFNIRGEKDMVTEIAGT